jgi:hypothetical protein
MSATPGLDALAELTGNDRDRLLREPRLLLAALRTAGRELVEVGLDLTDPDPATQAVAEGRRRAITTLLTGGPDPSPAGRLTLTDVLDRGIAALREEEAARQRSR